MRFRQSRIFMALTMGGAMAAMADMADMAQELRTMVGDAVYGALAEHLDGRRRQRNVVRFLPLAP